MVSQLRLTSILCLCFSVLLLLDTPIGTGTNEAAAQEKEASYRIENIQIKTTDGGTSIEIIGRTPPTYTVYELFDPLRVILDVADASFGPQVYLPIQVNEGSIEKITGKVLSEKEPYIAKIEVFLSGDSNYTVDRIDNNIVLQFSAAAQENMAAAPMEQEPQMANTTAMPMEKTADQADPESEAMMPEEDPLAELLASMNDEPASEESSSSISPIDKQLSRVGASSDKWAAAGFTKQRISVDFYKIDLHNVFRLFGEISGANMIIDQGVGGTLTLSLKDVPWDFALDIILNLKNLQKEERFNTIVISTKDKQFKWPEEPEKELEIKAPPPEIEIAIEQKLDMPAQMFEAKKYIHEGDTYANLGNMTKALELYEQAFDQMPDNTDLAKKIANICLVDLGLNAKAIHYAKLILKDNPNDGEAALQAAIAYANMRKPEAEKYFQIATAGERPPREALISYAAFAEENGDLDGAMSILEKYSHAYGEALETMIARARIYDQQGQTEKATNEYQAILYSGYPLEADLLNFIQGRVAQ